MREIAGPGVNKEPADRATLPVELQLRPVFRGPNLPVVLNRTQSQETVDTVLSPIIRGSTGLLAFKEYCEFVDTVMCEGPKSNALSSAARSELARLGRRRGTPFPGVDAYQLLKVATEVYVMLNCGVLTDLTFSDEIVAILKKPKSSALREGVPGNVPVANKTGGLEAVAADAGIVYLPNHPYILVVTTTYLKNNADGNDAIRRASRVVFDYFNRVAKSSEYGRMIR